MKRELSVQEIDDLIVGATILGVGGGGNPQDGLKSIMEQHKEGNKIKVWSLDEFSDSDRFASPYFVGSVAPVDANKKKVLKTVDDPIRVAFRILEEKLAKKISATVATEIGGGNTAASLAIAAKLDIPTVDGDLMGRAGPELHQSTTHIFGVSMVPAGIASETGNEILIEKYANIDDYEAVARYSSVISGGHVAVVDSPMTMAEAKKCIVQGTISKCIELGRARREAISAGKDPVVAIASKLDHGKKIFEGTVSKYSWKDERGFLFADAYVKGSGNFSGLTLRSRIMNEHIMCWIDEKPAVMPPDLIIFLEPETGLGITNDRLKEGMPVVVIGASIDRVWRKERGLELFGPRRFGFNYDYIPFETLTV
jgi:DUF917 family protein